MRKEERQFLSRLKRREYHCRILMKVMLNAHEVDFDACVNMMDDEIREKLHMDMVGECTEQEFLNRYCEAHAEKYGEEFCI